MLTFRSLFRYFPLPFRFLSSASLPLPATQPSVLPFLLFPVPPFSCFPGARLRSRFLGFHLLSDLVSHVFLPASCTRLYCWFPFVLPCFAPAAVPQVIPFPISLPGLMLDFRFLSVPSVLAPHYSASVSSFPLSSRLRLTVASSVRPLRSRFLGLPRSLRPGFPCRLSRFFVLGFLFVSFHPSRLRSHSRSIGASLLLSLSGFPLASAFFRPLPFGSDYSAFRPFLSLLPVLPCRRFLRCAPVPCVPFALLFRSACFHASLPISVLSFLRFFSPTPSRLTGLPQRIDLVLSVSAAPLGFRFRFGYSAQAPSLQGHSSVAHLRFATACL